MHSANRAKQRLRTSAAVATEATESKKTENKNKKINSMNTNFQNRFLTDPLNSRRSKSLERKSVSSRNKDIVKQRELQSPKPIRTSGKTLNFSIPHLLKVLC